MIKVEVTDLFSQKSLKKDCEFNFQLSTFIFHLSSRLVLAKQMNLDVLILGWRNSVTFSGTRSSISTVRSTHEKKSTKCACMHMSVCVFLCVFVFCVYACITVYIYSLASISFSNSEVRFRSTSVSHSHAIPLPLSPRCSFSPPSQIQTWVLFFSGKL